jgi:hypothetical protein
MYRISQINATDNWVKYDKERIEVKYLGRAGNDIQYTTNDLTICDMLS